MSAHHWIKLSSVPNDLAFGATVTMDRNNILLAPNSENEDAESVSGIYKYNINSNEWTKFIPYPSDFNLNCPGIAYSQLDHKLYLYDSNAQITVIHIKSQQFSVFASGHSMYDVYPDWYPPMINANGVTHLIVPSTVYVESLKEEVQGIPTHVLWDAKNKYFNVIREFQDFFSFHCFIHIKSKNVMLLLGVRSSPSYLYALNTGQRVQLPDINHIKYKLISAAVLTNDEKHIIMPCSDGLYVINIQFNTSCELEYKLQKSLVCLPTSFTGHAQCECLITGGWKDEILVIGYIKQLFMSTEFEDLRMPPIYLMKLISSWYVEEMIHLIEFNDGSMEREHVAIHVKNILSSLSDC
eukprot:54826_1